MTEQIERELAELFHDRAASLDVRPPLPVAAARRARLQSALAMASVVAVLAGGTVAGARLAGHSRNDRAALASSGDARHDLEQILDRMMAGRWHVDMTFVADPRQATPPTSSVDYDGTAKVAIARSGDRVQMIETGGHTYVPLMAQPELAKLLPAGAKWQELPGNGVGTASMFAGLSYSSTSSSGVDLSRDQVTRTATGYRLVLSDGSSRHVVFDIRIRPDGSVASMHGVIAPTSPSEGSPTSLTVDAVLTPLSSSFHVAAPDPRTVVTEAQFQAAIERLNLAGGTSGARPQACRTTSTTEGNGVSSSTVECSSQLTVMGGPGSGSPTFKVSPVPMPSHS